MEPGYRPEENIRASESEEPRYERRRSVSGPEHQYCAPGKPMHHVHQKQKPIVIQDTSTPIPTLGRGCSLSSAPKPIPAQCAKWKEHFIEYRYSAASTPRPQYTLTPILEQSASPGSSSTPKPMLLYTNSRTQCTKFTKTNTLIHQQQNTVHHQDGRVWATSTKEGQFSSLAPLGSWARWMAQHNLNIKYHQHNLDIRYQHHSISRYQRHLNFKHQHRDRDHQVLVEKLLRSTGVKKLYLLIRPRCAISRYKRPRYPI